MLLVADVQCATTLIIRLLAQRALLLRYCYQAFYLHADDRHKGYKRRYQQLEEIVVIQSTDAIIEPIAVVVKFSGAFVTISAMFAAFLHVHAAYLTIILIIRLILKYSV